MSALASLLPFVAAVATTAHDAATAESGELPLEAGAAPLLSPLTLVLLGTCLVGVAMVRTKLRQPTK